MAIFHPVALNEHIRFERTKRPFVYYTGVKTAASILQNGEFWMREVSRMNDFREVQHGLECIAAAFASSEGQRAKRIFESVHPNVLTEAMKSLDVDADELCKGTFIACMSEHGDDKGEEDEHGRLSMWRAYGGTEGVALILNPAPYFYSGQSELGVFTSPVAYLRDAGYVDALRQVNDGAARDLTYIKKLGAEGTRRALVNMLRFAAVCGKHPGFSDEREWRVLWNPTIGQRHGLTEETVTIAGHKQQILKIPISKVPALGICPVSALVQRVIIGPTGNPSDIREQMEQALTSAGVKEPASRIKVSDIPLRHFTR